jgi:predicted DNA-binding protein (MmcQ/YjbR family)
MTHKELEKYLLNKPGSWLDYPFGESVAVYKVGPKDAGKMFALIQEGKHPLQVSLKCDPVLAQTLRERYESVMPGYHLNKKHWNTIVVSGQLSDHDIFDLVDLSYRLVIEG